jgi:hypothetical protein
MTISNKLFIVSIICGILSVIIGITIIVEKASGQTQRIQQLPLTGQRFLPPPPSFQQPNIFQQLIQQQQQLLQQQQVLNQMMQQILLYNRSLVVQCLNKQLSDSVIKGVATGMITIRNNTNRTLMAGINDKFLTNATTALDACIIPKR